MITATKPFSPPIEMYQDAVNQIFKNNWFTNHGPFVTELEKDLASYFNVPYLVLVTNGTIALQIAIKALELSGEIITTPYSYVATTSSIVWENCKPRFADISPETLNIDPEKIEAKITNETSAILATNVYGFPCDFKAIEIIAKKNNLKVIYDNAHGFSTKFNGIDTMNFGDISTISFHATKLFHSVEGGAIACKSKEVYEKLMLLRNFGHTSPTSFGSVGVNAKMNELCAAMGKINLSLIDSILKKRKVQWDYYKQVISNSNFITLNYNLETVEFNKAYFPVFFESESVLLKVLKHLESKNISLRRYFYPSLNLLEYVNSNDKCEISEDISRKVLCLPLYDSLTESEQLLVVNTIKEVC
jgi:dTDP-4-amino-4,6-dideoxygalactose transaminase